MADTGRTVWADNFWADDFWAVGFWATDAAVVVPDVVGQDEASATVEITALGLTVSVTTAYSSLVAIGLVISQNPTSGTNVSPGSNVAIVISLGDAPSTSGGYVGAGGGGGSLFKRPKTLKEKPNKHLKQILEDVEQAYRDIVKEGEAPAEVAKIVAPFTESLQKLPPANQIDWDALEQNAEKVRQLLRIWKDKERKRQSDLDDEWFLLSD